jgi:uncharacterized protein (DUF2062 family)
MPRKFFRKYLPSHDSVKQNRYVASFGAFLHHPNLWHLNRHSVAGGVAIGMFSGLVPGPFQMLTAAILCILIKVNLPVALFTTLYTNPFTIGPLYLVAYQIGRLIVGVGGDGATAPAPEMNWSHLGVWLEAFGKWMLSLGKPLGIGLVALALALAALGYLFVHVAWRVHVVRAWRRRARQRRRR